MATARAHMATAPAQTIEDSIADEVYDVMIELCDLRQDMLRISTDLSRMADRVSVELEWTRSLMNRIDRAFEQPLTEPAARARSRSRRKARRNERRRWTSGTLVVTETADGIAGGDAVEAIDDVSLPLKRSNSRSTLTTSLSLTQSQPLTPMSSLKVWLKRSSSHDMSPS